MEYILEPQDVVVIRAALDYAHHRMTKHKKYFFANYRDLQRLRKELGIIDEVKYKQQLEQNESL